MSFLRSMKVEGGQPYCVIESNFVFQSVENGPKSDKI